MTKANWLYHRFLASPDKIAIRYDDKQLTYEQLFRQAHAISESVETSYPDAERIALLLNNSLDTISIIHGVTISSKELVLINSRLTAEEVRWQLSELDVDLIITENNFQSVTDRLENTAKINKDTLISHPSKFKSISKPVPKALSDVLCYVFTSGTTGKPKIVPLTYGNFHHSIFSSAFRLGVTKDDIWLLTMPMYHLGGLAIIFRSVIYGTSVICHQGFNPELIVRDLETEHITQISLVPTMLRRLLPYMDQAFDLRFILLGGAAAPIDLVENAIEKGLPLATTYGMTETCSQFATAIPEVVKMKPNSVGKPIFGCEVEIFDPDNDGIGEIGVKGPNVMKGYLKQVTPLKNGFLLTGDLGYLDEDGDLFVIQRRKDLIISGGENIYPSEVEQKLRQLDKIADACVIGIEDEGWGQIPISFLKVTEPIEIEEIEIALRSQLAKYKLPKKWFILEEFPKTASGKIQRNKLLEISQSLSPLD